MSVYGVKEQEPSQGGDLTAHVERVRTVGYTILRRSFDPPAVSELGTRLEEVVDRQAREFGERRIHAIGDALTARALLVDDDAFVGVAAFPPLLDLVRQLLGDYVVLMQQNGIVNPPDSQHTQHSYHRDLPYQHFVSSHPLAVSALFCIDSFRVETGATIMLPGSHHVARFPSLAAAAAMEVAAIAEPGSYIVFDSMLFHRAGPNRSGVVRRAVNNVYTIPLIAQQISLPVALQGRYRNDRELSQLLGYESLPAASSIEWRERRLARHESAKAQGR